MALWKEQVAPKKEPTPVNSDVLYRPIDAPAAESAPVTVTPTRQAPRDGRESVIGPEFTIEGKIEGAGHIRIAGRFKGDVTVEGNLTIEAGAKVTGGVKAHSVIIGGELDGNVLEAAKVELLESGVLNGDLKAGSLTVAAGSRMRGRAEFGWDGTRTRDALNGEGERDAL